MLHSCGYWQISGKIRVCENEKKLVRYYLHTLFSLFIMTSIQPNIRLTYQTISEFTFFMKVLHFSILNNILQHEITEKQSWTELFFI